MDLSSSSSMLKAAPVKSFRVTLYHFWHFSRLKLPISQQSNILFHTSSQDEGYARPICTFLSGSCCASCTRRYETIISSTAVNINVCQNNVFILISIPWCSQAWTAPKSLLRPCRSWGRDSSQARAASKSLLRPRRCRGWITGKAWSSHQTWTAAESLLCARWRWGWNTSKACKAWAIAEPVLCTCRCGRRDSSQAWAIAKPLLCSRWRWRRNASQTVKEKHIIHPQKHLCNLA